MTHRVAHERALEKWRKRLDKLNNPDHSKRREDYRGVQDPKTRAHYELRVTLRDFLAFGYTRAQVIKELDDVLNF